MNFNMKIGYQNIVMHNMVSVGLTYVREGVQTEILEGWVNPFTAAQLTKQEQLGYVSLAKSILLGRLLRRGVDKPDPTNRWKGVTYG
jgi:secreted Zn-dependent insulinase-like peptidase